MLFVNLHGLVKTEWKKEIAVYCVYIEKCADEMVLVKANQIERRENV